MCVGLFRRNGSPRRTTVSLGRSGGDSHRPRSACSPSPVTTQSASPTKSVIVGRFDNWYALSFGKRPAEELYDIIEDPDCVTNLALEPVHWPTKSKLRAEMEEMLRAEGDPRALGHPEVFDTYRYLGRRQHSYDSWLANQGG